MSTAFEAVLFDIDGTICEYNRSVDEILPIAFERAAVEPFFTAAEYIDRYAEFVDNSEDARTLRENVFEALAAERGIPRAAGRRVARAYAAERDHGNVRFLPGARSVLGAVAEQYPVGVVTNGAPEMQATKLAALGITDSFESIVYAGYETPAKPAPEPFESALATLETAPGKTLYVGNSVVSDVAGAHSAGLPAAWLDDGTADPEPAPDHVLDSIEDLTELL